ncbi:MAG: GNAT family N-acetyltransferase [Anaerolineales bacterium]|jgi:CelD/BcsL family acetyltransferase involved in cellulose biosynthesis
MIKIHSATLSPNKYQEYTHLADYQRYGVNLHPLWFATYLETFGGQEIILEARENANGDLVGLLPLVWKNINETRFLTLRRLVPLGYQPTDFFGILTVPGKEEEVTSAITNWLRENKNQWDQAHINLIPQDDLSWKSFTENLYDTGFHPIVTNQHAFFKLDTSLSYDDYLGSLGTKKRKELRYYMNKLSKAGNVLIVQITEDIERFFDDFLEHYAVRRSYTEQSDPFTRMPPLYHFVKNIISEYGDLGWMRLSILKINQKIIAYAYHMVYNHVLYYYMPAFMEEYQAYSPGKLLLSALIKNAFDDPNIREFNFMRSIQPYKQWFGPDKEGYITISINNPWSWRNKVLPIILNLSKIKKCISAILTH